MVEIHARVVATLADARAHRARKHQYEWRLAEAATALTTLRATEGSGPEIDLSTFGVIADPGPAFPYRLPIAGSTVLLAAQPPMRDMRSDPSFAAVRRSTVTDGCARWVAQRADRGRVTELVREDRDDGCRVAAVVGDDPELELWTITLEHGVAVLRTEAPPDGEEAIDTRVAEALSWSSGIIGAPDPRPPPCPADDSELAAVAPAVQHYVEVEPAASLHEPLLALGGCDVQTRAGTVTLTTTASTRAFARSCWARGGPAGRMCEGVEEDDETTSPDTIRAIADPTYTFSRTPPFPGESPVVRVEIGRLAQAYVFYVTRLDDGWSVTSSSLAWTT